jgi:hypothetical protein
MSDPPRPRRTAAERQALMERFAQAVASEGRALTSGELGAALLEPATAQERSDRDRVPPRVALLSYSPPVGFVLTPEAVKHILTFPTTKR